MASKKTKTSSTTNSTATTTPNVPTWINDSVQGQNNRINTLQNQDPYSFVAPTNQYSQAANNAALGLLNDNTANRYFGNAANFFERAGNAGPSYQGQPAG